jgi:hypothetical protein
MSEENLSLWNEDCCSSMLRAEGHKGHKKGLLLMKSSITESSRGNALNPEEASS